MTTTAAPLPRTAPETPATQRAALGTQHLALLAGILLLATALRLPHLSLVPQFTDESLEVLWSLPIARGESLPLTNYDAYYGGLFNYLVAGAFLLLGPSALAARLVVLAAGLLTVLAAYALGRAWGGRAVGLLTAALLSVCVPHVVISSHIAWANCTTPLFTTLAVLMLSLGLGRPRFLPLSGLLWGLALQTHPAVATLLPGAAVFVLWKGRRLFRGPWLYLGLLAFLLGYGNMIVHNLANGPESLLTAQRIRQDYATDQDAATSYPAALGAALLLLARILGSVVDNRAAPWEFVLDLPLLLGSGLALAGLIRLAGRGNPLPMLLVVSCLLLLPAVNPKFRTLISSRYLMPLAPILFAVIATELARLMAGVGPPLKVAGRHWLADHTPLSVIRGLWSVAGRPWLVVLALGAAATLLLAPLPRLVGYHERAFASGETNERVYALSRQLAEVRRPGEMLVLDEAFGSEAGGGVSELRALRYLLAFDEVPVRVIKATPKRLESELQGEPSLLVILNGRQVEEFERLRLEPLTPVPRRGREVGIFRFDPEAS